jgi:hypothetical protein
VPDTSALSLRFREQLYVYMSLEGTRSEMKMAEELSAHIQTLSQPAGDNDQ